MSTWAGTVDADGYPVVFVHGRVFEEALDMHDPIEAVLILDCNEPPPQVRSMRRVVRAMPVTGKELSKEYFIKSVEYFEGRVPAYARYVVMLHPKL